MRYNFPAGDDPKREYFSTFETKHWDFHNYKKHFKGEDPNALQSEYINALNWVLSHTIRNKDRAYIGRLIKRAKAALKKNTAAGPSLVLKAEQITIGAVGDNNRVVQNFKLPLKRDNSCLEDEDHENTEQRAEENRSQNERPNLDDNEPDDEVEEVCSLWDGWIKYIEAYINDKPENIYRPELHNVLWCGQGVHKRPGIPAELFDGIQDINNSNKKEYEKVFEGLEDYIDSVVDAPTLKEMDDAISMTRVIDVLPVHRNKFFFIKNIFTAVAENLYSSMIDPTTSEIAWNDCIIWPIIKACLRYMQRENQAVTFAPGEESLNSMSNPNSANPEPRYLADGVVRASKLDDLEICLLETSKALGKSGRPKKSFDHHKGMFGLLSMLKRAADTYEYATYEKFGLLKLLFLHGHGGAIRVWTLQSPQQDVYLMEKVLKVEIPTMFDKKTRELLPFVNSCWALLHHMIECIEALKGLQEAHERMIRDKRYSESSIKHSHKLSALVNPKIVRMTEKRHATIVTDDGPASSPIQMVSDEFDTESDGSNSLC